MKGTSQMATPPKVSIIIPAYNTRHFLPQTVSSALSQTWQDFELLIVDDGSTDGTGQWVAEQTDPRIHLVRQPNQGAAAARNTGIKHAKGKYIAFLDADDLWEVDKLKKQVAVLDSLSEVGLVHTAIHYIDENGDSINRILGVRGEGNVWREVVTDNPVRCGSTPLIRRECFDKLGVFDTSLSFAEDWEMWIRIARHYQFATINEPLVAYRQHKTNMTKSYKRIMPNFQKILERTFRDSPGHERALEHKAYGYAYLFSAWRAYLAGDVREAVTLHRQAHRVYPRMLLVKNSLNLSARLAKTRLLEPKQKRNHL